MVAATTKFYPRVQPPPDPAQTRKVNDAGQKARDKRTGKLSTLESWEGYRVFRDARSPTGWIDQHRLPIDAVDTNGHALRVNLQTGKLQYVSPTPAGSDGGLLGTLTKVLPFTGDVFGGILNLTGNEDLARVRVQTGVAAAGAIVAAGGLGASDVSSLTGGGGLSTLLGAVAPASAILPMGGPVASSTSRAAQSGGGDWLTPAILVLGAVFVVLVLSKRR